MSSLDFDMIRARHPLREYCEQRGIELHRNGAAGVLVGLCPFHQEKKGSFTVYPDERYHCFGCGVHGDITDLEQALGGGTRAEAAERLTGGAGINHSRCNGVSNNLPTRPVRDPYQLTSDDVRFANQASHRLASDEVLLARLVIERPEWSIDAIRGCALDGDLGYHEGELQFHYAHGIKARGKSLDGSRYFRWIVGNAGSQCWRQRLLLSAHETVFITEGESDAITMVARGYEATGEALVVALASATNLPDPRPFSGKDIAIIPDTDEAGIKCAARLRDRFLPIAKSVAVVDLKESENEVGCVQC